MLTDDQKDFFKKMRDVKANGGQFVLTFEQIMDLWPDGKNGLDTHAAHEAFSEQGFNWDQIHEGMFNPKE